MKLVRNEKAAVEGVVDEAVIAADTVGGAVDAAVAVDGVATGVEDAAAIAAVTVDATADFLQFILFQIWGAKRISRPSNVPK
jgi:hypothetical protein